MSDLTIPEDGALATCKCGWSGIPASAPGEGSWCPWCAGVEQRKTADVVRERTRLHVEESVARRERAKWTAVAEERGLGRNDLCPCGSGRKAKRCHVR